MSSSSSSRDIVGSLSLLHRVALGFPRILVGLEGVGKRDLASAAASVEVVQRSCPEDEVESVEALGTWLMDLVANGRPW